MSTITINELENKTAREWLKTAARGDLIVTSEGQPVAVIMQLASGSLESAKAFVRSIRALHAQTDLQKFASENGTSDLSETDIDIEISAARRDRRRK